MQIKLYKYIGEPNRISKINTMLTHVVTLNGNLRDVLNITDPQIIIDVSITSNIVFSDLSDQNIFPTRFYEWNYVYIEDFNRYYFIRNITVTSKNLIVLNLHVDVLKSFDNFINRQSAYISRNELEFDELLPDERRVILNQKEIFIDEPTNGSLVNTTFDVDFSYTTDKPYRGVANVVALGTTLPLTKAILELRSETINDSYDTSITALPDKVSQTFAFAITTYPNAIQITTIADIMAMAYHDDNLASYIGNICVYPFDIREEDSEVVGLIIKDQVVKDKDGNDCDAYSLPNISKERIIADFVVEEPLDFNDLEPYSMYEIYIPYYGWKEFPYNATINHRILVFYIINYVKNTTTVYLYDYTEQIILFSSSCQLGVEIAISTSNIREVNDRSTINRLNLTLNMIGSALTGIGGLVKGSPLTVGASALNISKTLSQYYASELTNYQRAQVQFGGNGDAVVSPQKVYIRKTKSKLQYYLTLDFLHTNGGVLNEYRMISTLSGYTEISDIIYDYNNVDVQPLDNELDEITSLLKTGIYV